MIINIVLISFIVFLLIVLTMVWPPDSPWSPWWRTNRKVARAACKLAGISSSDEVFELGSGDGTFLLTASQEFGAKCTGIEIDHSRFFISKLNILFNRGRNIKLIRSNFYSVNLSPATIVFVYLVPRALGRLAPKLLKELKVGTKIISYRYKFPKDVVNNKINLSHHDKKNNIFVYEIKSK